MICCARLSKLLHSSTCSSHCILTCNYEFFCLFAGLFVGLLIRLDVANETFVLVMN